MNDPCTIETELADGEYCTKNEMLANVMCHEKATGRTEYGRHDVLAIRAMRNVFLREELFEDYCASYRFPYSLRYIVWTILHMIVNW